MAQEACEEAIALHPLQATAHRLMGDIMIDAGDGVAAAASYRRAMELAPELEAEAWLHLRLSRALRLAKEFEVAARECERALELEPANEAAKQCLERLDKR
jgi:tetratricopeptide (TPR) repeat protein